MVLLAYSVDLSSVFGEKAPSLFCLGGHLKGKTFEKILEIVEIFFIIFEDFVVADHGGDGILVNVIFEERIDVGELKDHFFHLFSLFIDLSLHFL